MGLLILFFMVLPTASLPFIIWEILNYLREKTLLGDDNGDFNYIHAGIILSLFLLTIFIRWAILKWFAPNRQKFLMKEIIEEDAIIQSTNHEFTSVLLTYCLPLISEIDIYGIVLLSFILFVYIIATKNISVDIFYLITKRNVFLVHNKNSTINMIIRSNVAGSIKENSDKINFIKLTGNTYLEV